MSTSGLEAAFLANRAALLRFLRARGAGMDAEDVAQDVWLRLSATRAPVSDAVAYLYRMADNLMIDRKRSEIRRSRREEEWEASAGATTIGVSDLPSPERSMLAREQLRTVEERLATLGERTTAIFRRFRIDGISQVIIAKEQGISVSAVEKHLQKAYRVIASIRPNNAAGKGRRDRLGMEGTTNAGN